MAVDDEVAAVEDRPETIAVLANDSDLDGGGLLVTAVGTPAHGFAAINADGTIGYTPEPHYNGADTFTYTIGDGAGGTATASVRLTVTAAPDAPLGVRDVAATREDASTTIAVLANDFDPDGDALSVTALGAVTNGTAAANPDGTITFTPAPNFNGMGSFSYTVGDGRGRTATSSVSVTVIPVNDGPTAADDVATTARGTAVSIAVLANDGDPDGDSLSVTIGTPPAHGTVAVNADGTVTYTPAADYRGPDSFSYHIQTGAVALAWDASPGPDVAGYRIHYGTQSGVYTAVVDVGPALEGVVHGLTEGRQYYFGASAYNRWDVESVLSAEVQAVVVNRPGAGPETTATATVRVTVTEASGSPAGSRLRPEGAGTLLHT
jgi:hypothetical protein